MKNNKLDNIDKLIKNKKINQAQIELSKLGSEFLKNSEYLYLRSKIFYINRLYYIALDTLLIALEFEENEKVYNLISEIYDVLDNKKLSKKVANPDSRLDAITSLKNELTGSNWTPYFTQIHLYRNQLEDPVIIANLPRAIQMRDDMDLIITFRMDH